ncbi:MAG: hypothetical protein NC305_18850 [Lachnospiraceae bacterium]|nr:hypothetical protein [Lachnospiraceae bacterium]
MNQKIFLEIVEHIDNLIRSQIGHPETASDATVKINISSGKSLMILLGDIEPHESFVVLESVTGEEKEFIPYENIISLGI